MERDGEAGGEDGCASGGRHQEQNEGDRGSLLAVMEADVLWSNGSCVWMSESVCLRYACVCLCLSVARFDGCVCVCVLSVTYRVHVQYVSVGSTPVLRWLC